MIFRLLLASLIVIVVAAPAAASSTRDAEDEPSVADSMRNVVIVTTTSCHGSAVVVADGRLVTAAHVVAGVDAVELRTSDDREFGATVVRRDQQRDIAVLQASELDLPGAPLRSQPPKIGDLVYAVGAPMGDYLQLTSGIVSALPELDEVAHIQTDAPINPGNSGGPLLDADGRVVGIVVVKRSVSEGIGWATATSEVEAVLSDAPAEGAHQADVPTAPAPTSRAASDAAVHSWVLVALPGALVLGAGLVFYLVSGRRRSKAAARVVLPPLDLTEDPEFNARKARTWTP